MSSESDQESTSLKARLKAKLQEARIVCESSDDEDVSKRKKSGFKHNTSIQIIASSSESSDNEDVSKRKKSGFKHNSSIQIIASSSASSSKHNGTNGVSTAKNTKTMKTSNGLGRSSISQDSDSDDAIAPVKPRSAVGSFKI